MTPARNCTVAARPAARACCVLLVTHFFRRSDEKIRAQLHSTHELLIERPTKVSFRFRFSVSMTFLPQRTFGIRSVCRGRKLQALSPSVASRGPSLDHHDSSPT